MLIYDNLERILLMNGTAARVDLEDQK